MNSATTTPCVDYYFAPQSPWAYLGHQRLQEILQQTGATVRVLPVDLGGKVFPVSGGLPLAQRAPQRQAYRLLELKRFSEWLQLPLTPQPRFFPVQGDDAARLIIAVELKDGPEAAMGITGALMRAVWAEQRDIADEGVRAALLAEQGLPPQRIEEAKAQAVQERYVSNTERAIAIDVFGAPSYVVDGEIFWGQDRLDFLQRRLQRPA